MAQLDLFDNADTLTSRAIADGCDMLPPLGRELVEVMGLDAAVKLMTERGGQRMTVYDPRKRPTQSYLYLEEIVGHTAAMAYVGRWGNLEIQVPKGTQALKAMRNRKIINDYSSGTKVPELARQHDLTEGQVWRVLKWVPPA